MESVAPLIYDLAIMLGVASIVIVLCQRLNQPVVLGYLVAGVIIGPYTPPYELINDIGNIQTLSELGVIFLMFALGLEFSFQKLARIGAPAAIIGSAEVVFMIAVGYGAGRLMEWPVYDSLFLGAALSISSTVIIIKALEGLNLKSHRFAELVFGVLIIEDLLAILLLVALSTIVKSESAFSFDIISAAIKLAIVVSSWFLIGYFLVPRIFKKIARYINNETLTIISVALCLFLVCISDKFDYSDALGAFIMGSILAETVLIKRIETLIQPIRDIFAAVFFISVGMLINPTIIMHYWKEVLFVVLLTIVGKMLAVSVAAKAVGETKQASLRIGASMAQVGEFSFIIVALGVELNVVTDKLYPLMVAVASVTAFTTPYLIRMSMKWLKR